MGSVNKRLKNELSECSGNHHLPALRSGEFGTASIPLIVTGTTRRARVLGWRARMMAD
jgi:hypothetical protein